MSTAVAVVLLAAVVAYAVFGGADFGAGFWDLTAGGPERGARPRAVIEHSIGPVWEANHVWLIFIFVVLWTSFPEAYASITLTLFVPLTIAALGIVLRGASFAFRKAVVTHPQPAHLRSRVRRLLGAGAVLHGSDRRRRSPRDECRPAARRVIRGQLDQPDLHRRWCPGRRARRPTWPRSTSCGTPDVWARRTWSSTSAAEQSPPPSSSAVIAVAGVFVLRADADYLFDGLTSRALPVLILSGACGVGARPAAGPRRRPRRPGTRRWSRSPASSSPGVWRSGPTSCRRA